MRRLKEGFYTIMKISNQVKDKPELKQQLITFTQENKIEKPETDVIVKVEEIQIQVDLLVNEGLKEEGATVATHQPGKQRAKTKGGKKGPPLAFKKKLQLAVAAEDQHEPQA